MCANRIRCAVSFAALIVVGQARAAVYDVVDLGYLPNSGTANSAGSEGLGIDDAGEAAASSDVNDYTTHGMYWNGATSSDLDTPSSTVNTLVHGMGPSGKIVGENGVGFAFVWSHGGGFTNLANLGGTTGAAFGMNAAGDVVGTDSQGSLVYGVVWKLATGAPTQLTPASSKFFAIAHGINSSRTIAGISFDNSFDLATVWNYNSGSGTWTPQSLGTLGGVGSDAFDINTAGNVVGYATRASGQGEGAFIWHPGDTSVTDLDPAQDFSNSFASGINDNNVIVGSDTNGGAFVWDSAHGMRNLQDLIDPTAPYYVTDARDVNDNGWIIGTATNTNDNLPHAVIFKPILQILPGDYNRDQHVDAADVNALELALTNLTSYKNLYGVSDAELLQINQLPGESTTALNNSYLQALLTYLKTGGGSSNPVPEPTSACLAFVAAVCCGIGWRLSLPY
jgi:probable HAF family extracellular repeat protein